MRSQCQPPSRRLAPAGGGARQRCHLARRSRTRPRVSRRSEAKSSRSARIPEELECLSTRCARSVSGRCWRSVLLPPSRDRPPRTTTRACRGGQEPGHEGGPRAAVPRRCECRANPMAPPRLHWAAHWNDTETADALIKAGANVNAANDLGVTPLLVACADAGATMVATLLKAGANPNLALPNGESPLMTAARTGQAESVKALLARGADVNARESSRGQTALMWATAERHSEVVRLLIDARADVHARSAVRKRVGFVAAQPERNRPQRRRREAIQPRVRGRRIHGPAVCGAAGRCRIRDAAARGRRRRERHRADRHERARGRRPQRQRERRHAAPREGRRPQRRPGGVYGASCRGARGQPDAGQEAARTRRESRRQADEGDGGAPLRQRVGVRGQPGRRDALLSGRQVRRTRDHAGARGRQRRRAACRAGRVDAAHDGARHADDARGRDRRVRHRPARSVWVDQRRHARAAGERGAGHRDTGRRARRRRRPRPTRSATPPSIRRRPRASTA